MMCFDFSIIKCRKKLAALYEKKRMLEIRIESNDVLTDDDLRYETGGYVYPVTQSMLRQPFYLDTEPGKEITFLSRSSAKIEIKDG